MAIVVDGKTLLTYSDYVLFPEDRDRHEIIEGVHYVTPSPSTKHQRVSRWIQFQLFEQIELRGLGEVFDAPMDVILSETNVVQPDVLVVLQKNRRIITEKNIRGAPDLVIEITSPTTRARDLELKKDLYERHGVNEYWVVLTDQDRVEKYVRDDDAYGLRDPRSETIAFSGLPGVAVDLTKVW